MVPLTEFAWHVRILNKLRGKWAFLPRFIQNPDMSHKFCQKHRVERKKSLGYVLWHFEKNLVLNCVMYRKIRITFFILRIIFIVYLDFF